MNERGGERVSCVGVTSRSYQLTAEKCGKAAENDDVREGERDDLAEHRGYCVEQRAESRVHGHHYGQGPDLGGWGTRV